MLVETNNKVKHNNKKNQKLKIVIKARRTQQIINERLQIKIKKHEIVDKILNKKPINILEETFFNRQKII